MAALAQQMQPQEGQDQESGMMQAGEQQPQAEPVAAAAGVM
jgi:hypothetical protein